MIRPLAFVAIFALGTLASRLIAAHAPTRLGVDFAQPVPVATAWGAYGSLSLGMLLVTLVAAFAAYAALLRRPPPVRVTIATAAAACCFAAWFTPLFSSDIYAYAAYGEMARIGLNPYAHAALPASNPTFAAAVWQWPQLPVCVYGESFVAIARGIASLFADASVAWELNAFRMLATFSLLACAVLCAGLQKRTRNARFAAVFLGCNPVVLWSAIEGHNDALAIAVAMAALFIGRRSASLASIAAAVAVSIKLPAIAVFAVTIVRSISHRARGVAASCIAAAIVAAAYARWFSAVLSTIAPHGHFIPFASVAAVPWSAATWIVPQSPAFAATLTALTVTAVALAVALHARTYTGLNRLLAIALALWVLVPNPYPWYGIWIVALAAFASDPKLRLTALAVTAIALLRYVPDAVAVPSLALNLAGGVLATSPYAAILTVRKRAIISRSS